MKPIYTKLGTEISQSFVEILKNGLAWNKDFFKENFELLNVFVI